MKRLVPLLLVFFCSKVFAQSKIDFSSSSAPLVFAPGFISDGFENRDITISLTNDELFFTIQHKAFSVIMTSKKKGEQWSQPEVASFSGKFHDLEAAYSPDGKKIFFTSNRPLSDTGTIAKDYDIWYVEKKNNTWSGPYNAGPIINTGKDEFYPSIAKNGNLYFTRDNDSTKEDILVSFFKDNSYTAPVALPKEVNSNSYDFNAFIDPDESFIIFTSYKRKDDKGGGDLYISSCKAGIWQAAKNMGDGINSTSIDYCPFISFDKKHFFFTSKKNGIHLSHIIPINAKMVHQLLSSAGNGTDDIYRMDFSSIRMLLQE